MNRVTKVLAALSSVVALGAPAAEVRTSEPDDAVAILGTVQAGDDAKFAALIAAHPTNKLIVQSAGGDFYATLAIARQVHERGMTVIVDAFCASACAQLLFAAAAERRLRPDAFVAFHAGNLPLMHAVRDALLQTTLHLKEDTEPANRAAWQRALERSQADAARVDAAQSDFDAGMKLDPAVGEFYRRLTAPARITVALNANEKGEVSFQAAVAPGTCDWWAPDQEGLARLGLGLRNTYTRPPMAAIAHMMVTPESRMYGGPPVAVDDPSFGTLCRGE